MAHCAILSYKDMPRTTNNSKCYREFTQNKTHLSGSRSISYNSTRTSLQVSTVLTIQQNLTTNEVGAARANREFTQTKTPLAR